MTDLREETKRDRVRRLLITPLEQAGMRAKRGTDPDVHKNFLNRLCDEQARLNDADLIGMRRWAEVNGEGSAKRFWPGFVSFAGLANTVCSRPLDELPELHSWFLSRAGEEAQRVPGRLVAELEFMERHRRPPTHPAEQNRIAENARRLWADVERARDLRDHHRPHDAALIKDFDTKEARAAAIVEQGKAKRAAQAKAEGQEA